MDICMKHTIKVIVSNILFFSSYALYGMNCIPITELKNNPNLILTDNVFSWIANQENISKVDVDNNNILHYFGKIKLEQNLLEYLDFILNQCDKVLESIENNPLKNKNSATLLMLNKIKNKQNIFSSLPKRLAIHLIKNYIWIPPFTKQTLLEQKNNNHQTPSELCYKRVKKNNDIIVFTLLSDLGNKLVVEKPHRPAKRKLNFDNDDNDSIN